MTGDRRGTNQAQSEATNIKSHDQDPAETPMTMVEVRRSNISGRTSNATLYRQQEKLFLVSDEKPPRSVQAPDVVGAFATVAALRRVQPGELLEIWVEPEAGCQPSDIATRLRIAATRTASDQSSDWNAEPSDNESLDYFVCAGIGTRAVMINDDCWLAVKLEDRARRLLVPADPSWTEGRMLLPLVEEPWAAFSCIENASMTSGTSTWSLDLLSRGIVMEFEDPNEGRAVATFRRTSPGSRLKEIVRWLTDLPTGLDLCMLAVETVIGELEDTVFGSDFDDDASDSLECDLFVAVEQDKIEQFLSLLCRAGRRDAVDAVRRPRSGPGKRRAERRRRASQEEGVGPADRNIEPTTYNEPRVETASEFANRLSPDEKFIVNQWLERGNGVAAYYRQIDRYSLSTQSSNVFVSFGSSTAQIHDPVPPALISDDSSGWRPLKLQGYYRGEPL